MSFKHIMLSAATVAASCVITSPAIAGPDEYIGQIMIGGWNFCPRASTRADGQLLAISSNTALFSLFGTTYGGDGRTTFGLPDLRGRIAMHNGQGPGLSNRPLGSKGGTETNTMTTLQMPSHTHNAGIQTTDAPADSTNAKSNAFGIATANTYVDNVAPAGKFMHINTVRVNPTGGGQAQNNMQPYQAVMYCVVTQGIFPSRN